MDKHIVAVTGIIIKDGKYLITRRNLNKKAFPGKWTVPGGRLEVKDYINDNKDTSEHWYNVLEKVLKREVKEEVGLDIKNIRYLVSMTFMRGEDPTLIISLYAEHDKGEVVLNEESIDYEWVSLNEAKNYELIEGIYEELEMLDKILKGEKVEWEIENIKRVLSEEKKEEMIIEDPVYGKEVIKEPILIELINSKSVQRLKEVSQYGIPDEYYHKKGYSRYNHSLGVFILLRRLDADIKEQIAGLLHDVSHTAFSHVIDWTLGNLINENYQDNNHLNVIENSELKQILGRAGFDYKEIAKIENFSLLEKEIPSLCADRIDYALRELRDEGLDIKRFVLSLMNKDGQIVFKDRKLSEKFAREFLRLQNEHWAGNQAMGRYYILSSIFRKAIESKILSVDNFYLTEQEVLNKLKESKNSYIIENLELLRKGLIVETTSDEFGVLLKKKFRYIDPEVLVNGEVRRLSELSEEFKGVLEKEKENSIVDRRFVFKKLDDETKIRTKS